MIVALLDSMWGWGGYNDAGEDAPRYFRINPDNHSGRRLYRLVGSRDLLVTNSCRVVQAHANSHGTPDPEWVRENLLLLHKGGMDLLLVCGKIARYTFSQVCKIPIVPLEASGFMGIDHSSKERFRYLAIDHPAARRWSIDKLNQTQQHIERLLRA